MCPALYRRQDALLGGDCLAGAGAGHGDPAQSAGATSAAASRNADTGAVQHLKQLVAALGFDRRGVVHGHRQGTFRHQLAARDEQPDREREHDQDDDSAADEDLCHSATIWAKAEKPSDIRPVSRKVMPRPRRPTGRSA